MEMGSMIVSDEENYIFTEDIDYSKTSANSIWGDEEKSTSDLIRKTVKESDIVVNLAAGDGRYNNLLLSLANKVVAVDIDEDALNKLSKNTPPELKERLELKVFNIVEKFPLDNDTYDGIFSTGTLYLFPEKIFMNIAKEMSRIVKVGGYIILEYAYDIKRISATGEEVKFGNEPLYSREGVIDLINRSFMSFSVEFIDGEEVTSVEQDANPPYEFNCKTLLIKGSKNR